jgi:phosphoribosylformylglycinamidine synthase subunit PurSL
MPNICSKESIVRQYDHEVLGMSVIKPFCGEKGTGPSDAAVIQPFDNKHYGIVVSHGICPRISRLDAYTMAQVAVDEAVRNYICVGGDPHHWAALDNFCWPDPVASNQNPDGEYKLAQLVRANKGMAEACIEYGLPLISGKDSMKNDYKHGEKKISIQPTLLISIAGKIVDVNKSISSDFKRTDNLIYVLGQTTNHMGCSEYYSMHGLIGKNPPSVNLRENIKLYKRLHRAMVKGLVTSAHDCSDGGLGCAIAEMCIGGQRGARIRLSDVPRDDGLSDAEVLFSESAGRIVVAVDRSKAKEFEHELHDLAFGYIGQVIGEDLLLIDSQHEERCIIKLKLQQLEDAFRGTITW